MENKLHLIEKKQYGRTRVFANCHQSKLLMEWVEKKCFGEIDLIFMKKLGYEVEIVKE